MSWKSWLVERLGRRPGWITSAAVYGLGGAFYSRWMYQCQGEGSRRQPAAGGRMTVSFDVDYPEDVRALPELCGLLRDLEITASFAVVGMLVEKFPREHALLVEYGHELLNHTHSHPDHDLLNPEEKFDLLPPDRQAEEIGRCTEVCRRVLDVEVKGFRAPHFGNVRGAGFYRLLAAQGYDFSSSRLAPRVHTLGLPLLTDEGVWEFPVGTCPRHPFAVLDTWHALRKPASRHARHGEFAGLCRQAVSLAEAYNGYLNLYFDPRDVIEYPDAIDGLRALSPGAHELKLTTYAPHLRELEASAVQS